MNEGENHPTGGNGQGITRRSFLKNAGVAGAAVSVAGGLGSLAPSQAGAQLLNPGQNNGVSAREVSRPSNEEVPLDGRSKFYEVSIPSSVLEEQLVSVPLVTPVAGELAGEQSIFGRLSLPESGAPKTVMLALHGITYDNSYWNSGFEPQTYNFSRFMTDAGYAVFAIDRLGYGSSSHPPSQLVTLDSQSAVAHEIIGALKRGEIGGTRFERVILVGHSYGSATSWLESSIHNDADAIIATGWANGIQTEPFVRFFSGFRPAQQDPKFADRGLPPGYLTPGPPGPRREQNFLYDLSNADTAMIDYDDRVLRDTVADAEGLTFYNRYGEIPLTNLPTTSEELTLPLSDHLKDINIPTFLINGASDLFFVGIDQRHGNSSQALQRAEAEFFPQQACFRAAVVPNAGHNLNLQRNARFAYDTIRTYADQVLGPDGSNYDNYLANCEEFSGDNIPEGQATFGPFGNP